MTDIPHRDAFDLAGGVHAGLPADEFEVETADHRQWRRWLAVLLLMAVAIGATTYTAVILIDPFSTGRFSLTQRTDFTTSFPRLAFAGLVRDPQFNGAILGDSTASSLDPAAIAGSSGWRIAQLAIQAATPANIFTMARSYARHHRTVSTLEILVLSFSWCRDGGPEDNARFAFPDWLYESSPRVYLSRIFFLEAAKATLIRIGIWLGLADQALPPNGYTGPDSVRYPQTLVNIVRPTGGPQPQAPFPALDALVSYLSALPADTAVVLVVPPQFADALPAAGSVADARLLACKGRIRDIATSRPRTAHLDLMSDDATTRNSDNFIDPIHVMPNFTHLIEVEIARLVKDLPSEPGR